MTITVAMNSAYAHLNGSRAHNVKDGGVSRERSMIVDITFSAGQNYVTGGNTIDFSKVGFKTVYYCEVMQKSYVPEVSYVVASGNNAATGLLKVWDVNGSQLSNGSTATQSMTLTVLIRGN